MYDAIEVAWKMLQVAKSKNIQLSNLQLQKLVYIAHGYMLGWKNRPLIKSKVSAWKFGPVIDEIYHEFKQYSDSKIPTSNIDEITTSVTDAESEAVIAGVLDLYGDRDAIQLVNLTHQPETPWDEIWNQKNGKKLFSAAITDDLIKNHFRKVILDPTSVQGL